jgi:hypothetical protein
MAYDMPDRIPSRDDEESKLPPEQNLLFRAMHGADELYERLSRILGQEGAAEAASQAGAAFLEQAVCWKPKDPI